MLVQYGEGGAVKTSAVRAPVPTAHQAVPQMVQIVNPQTGQIQHVLQHIQPQIQMQQVSILRQLRKSPLNRVLEVRVLQFVTVENPWNLCSGNIHPGMSHT